MTVTPSPSGPRLAPPLRRGRRPPARGVGARREQAVAGWLLTLPLVVVLGTFLVTPILLGLYVSVTGWRGSGDPLVRANAPLVGLDNYRRLLTGSGLVGRDFMTSIGNTVWYALLVVPLQTVCAVSLALLVDRWDRRGRGVLRTLYYLPSVTSAVATTAVTMLVFAGDGVVNALLALVGVDGPAWLSDSRGTLHLLLGTVGVDEPGWGRSQVLGRDVWQWLAGPSVAMLVLVLLAVWTTTGTFMLLYLAALQDLPRELDDAAAVDGATGWARLRWVVLPQLRPVTRLVVLLGLIGTWQVFDQVYATGGGRPGKTLLTPAYVSYEQSFGQAEMGTGAAAGFLVCALVVGLSLVASRVGRSR